MSASRPETGPEWLSLGQAETVALRAAPSKNLVLAALGAGMVLVVVVSVVVATLGNILMGRILSFAVLVFVLALLGGIYLVVHRWEYAVTSDRVCAVRGFRSRTARCVPRADVRDVTFEQSRWQRLVDVGDLLFVTDDGVVRFRAVGNPRHVYEQVLAHVG